MFEKEAEEYYEDVTVGTFQECTENFADAVLTAYKDGAEFGYNKAKKELEEFIVSHRKERDYVFDAWHKQIEYAKTIIQDLLSNSDEYARQRAIDFLKEKEPKSRDNRNNYQDKSTPCYYSRKGKNNYQYSSMGIVDPENYDYISARQYHERYEDTE